MGHPLRLGLQRGIHDRFDLDTVIGRFTPATRRNLPQTREAVLGESGAPQHHGLAIDRQVGGDRRVRLRGRRRQHDAASQRDLLRRTLGAQPAFDLFAVMVTEAERWECGRHAAAYADPLTLSSYLLDTTLATSPDLRAASPHTVLYPENPIHRPLAPTSYGFGTFS